LSFDLPETKEQAFLLTPKISEISAAIKTRVQQ